MRTPTGASSGTSVAPFAGMNCAAATTAARAAGVLSTVVGVERVSFVADDERVAPATVTPIPAQSTTTNAVSSTPPDLFDQNLRSRNATVSSLEIGPTVKSRRREGPTKSRARAPDKVGASASYERALIRRL